MAYSYVAYTGNGSTTQFALTFAYIRKEHIKVYVNYVDTNYTWVNSSLVQLASAPGNGVRVEVRRITPLSTLLVDYADGSTLVAGDMDTSNLQHLYKEQEFDDAQKQTVFIDPATGLATLGNQRLTNVGFPINSTDAVTKAYADSIVSTGVADGDRGDIVVLGAGTSWTIDSGVVTNSKIANGTIAANKLAPEAFTDGINSTSTNTIATPNSVKTAYDLAAAALPKSGGIITGDVDNTATGYFDLPVGTTAQRPGTPNSGMIRFNTDSAQYEGYNGVAWSSIGGGAQGGGADKVFVETDQVISQSYTLSTGKNAMTAGPVAIQAGAIVTVPSGASWVIV